MSAYQHGEIYPDKIMGNLGYKPPYNENLVE
jgi:hypothetical protein